MMTMGMHWLESGSGAGIHVAGSGDTDARRIRGVGRAGVRGADQVWTPQRIVRLLDS
jgi:hypothetical protein